MTRRIQEILLSWFAAQARPLPWRTSYDPYQVFVSEIMLQQTQMERAVAYFTRFTARFPDIRSLAEAGEDEVVKLWEGLGYYARARNLLKAARIVVAEHGGRFPEDPETIAGLPGIGPYTAAAIAAIAFNTPAAALDANAGRVLARLFDVDTPVASAATRAVLKTLAEGLIPAGRAREFTQAAMEFGALVCTPKNPGCARCPLAGCCEARRLGIVPDRPVLTKPKKIIALNVASGLLVSAGRVFVQRRKAHGVWAGLWEFPGGVIEPGETPEAAIVREFAEETAFAVAVKEKIDVIRHGYTSYRVSLHCFLLALTGAGACPDPVLSSATSFAWARLADLHPLTFPAGHRKLIDRIEREEALRERLGIK